ncbi:MAG: glycosyl hydrolase family 18 protein [Thermaerobacter sp.]|nr:glycosyl hydrolase family 18 protein [Thermaerobacter sp.]
MNSMDKPTSTSATSARSGPSRVARAPARRLAARGALGLASSLLWTLLLPAAAWAATPAAQVEAGSVTMTASAHTAPVGGSVTFTASASDPGGTPEYQWWVEEPNGQWISPQNYSTDATFHLSTPSAGDYLVVVYALDQQAVAQKQWAAAQRPLPDGVFVNSTVSATASGDTAGQPVTLSATAQNIYDPLYQFWVESPSGTWSQSGNYGTSNQFTFTPANTGPYRYVAYVKSPAAANDASGALMTAVGTATALGAAASVSLAASTARFAANGSGNDQLTVTVANASGQTIPQFSGQVALSAGSGLLFNDGTSSSATVSISGGSGTVTLALPSTNVGTYTVTAENLTGNDGPGVASTVSYGQATVTATYPLISVGWGYFYPQNFPGGYYDLTHHYADLTAIVPDWYYLNINASGTVGTPVLDTYPSASMIAQVSGQAAAHNVMMWPSIGWAAPGNLDALRSAANVSAIVSGMTNLAVSNNYQGLTIDFEGMGSPSATTPTDPTPAYQVFNNFVAALAASLHHVNKTLMVAVYPSAYPYTIYDYPALAASANYLNVMGYPEYNTGYPSASDPYPGPTAGFPWLQGLLSGDLTTGVNPHQLILGLAPYGHGWTYTSSGYVCTPSGKVYPECGSYISNYTAQALINANGITPTWDPWQKEEVFTAGPAAVAPPSGLSSATTTAGPSNAVRSLQSLLDYVLIRYAVASGQSEPPLMITDGYYGPVTESAVALFQQDFNVATTSGSLGVYNAATAAALSALISQWHIGATVYWTDTGRSTRDRVALSAADHLGGVAMWRLGFETENYWLGFESVGSAIKQGG